MNRIEKDSMGEINVPKEVFWGAQTQRSLENFHIGTEKMPLSLIEALIQVKKICAVVNENEKKLSIERSVRIQDACSLLLNDLNGYAKHFPLCLWQTGSGTQTNMNVNEVIAHLASSDNDIHPNDHVNLSQSSNDVFPTAMHIAAISQVKTRLIPEIEKWLKQLTDMERQYANVIKIGRTHMQDATPVTFGQEVSGWKGMIENSRSAIQLSSDSLLKLAIGGTAVGTGLNAPDNFGIKICQELEKSLGIPFISESNKFFALTSHQPISFVHGALRALASDLMKIANDIRWLASGPRNGLAELTLPSNEPGSSIMPGKINPTQAEALTMITTQVMGNDTTIQIAASQGNFELNVYKPVLIYNFLQTVTLLTDGMQSFREKCLKGISVNEEKMTEYVSESLMLVTAFTPYIGYEKAAEIAKKALSENQSLRESALSLGYATIEELDNWLNPKSMI
ncbi:fumarase, class II [Carnobacterium iners]|uniref:Fumarate hydratase class II n=1 Tax=Carnobacterium iners TaxID=1073423 RepID=A0A1X7MP22_9LACT|nr:class II fumarate hydratase [Carnobacterium iners]SEL09360.1 fumarase, class II [Carnobacterium iners]SMH26582.1 fumarase, class II [Carnobacterium iners]